jgi:plastocyanin
MIRKRLLAVAALSGGILLAACGGDSAQAASAAPATQSGATTAAVPTGNVVEVKMVSDPSRGEIFEPATVTVKSGDVIRWTLTSGVHNASFPPAKNPSGATLPKATPYLQAPGQTHDMPVDLPPGEYHFQCDPHAMLGMVGTLIVE